jgi:hypothetical protein
MKAKDIPIRVQIHRQGMEDDVQGRKLVYLCT